MNQISATVVIPAQNRQTLVQRAIESVLSLPESDLVQIIVVDDDSSPPLQLAGLRRHDELIHSSPGRGAAVSRNIGINRARGEIIYLLDSDDLFVYRSISRDLHRLRADPGILFCEISSGRYRSSFPRETKFENFLSSILSQDRFITQTSSLCFSSSLGLRFDEALPKHQDWDFIFSAILKGISVSLGDGLICFDRSDRFSISRTPNKGRSAPWISKLRHLESKGVRLEIPADLIEVLLTGRSSRGFAAFTIVNSKILLSSKLKLSTRIKHVAKLITGRF